MSKLEKLAPDNLGELAVCRLAQLEKLIESLKLELRNPPSGRLRVSSRRLKNGSISFQYYHVTETGPSGGNYLVSSSVDIASAISQRDYNFFLLDQANRQAEVLRQFIQNYQKADITTLKTNFSLGRQRLIRPVTLSDEEYSEAWLSVPYKRKSFSPDSPEFFTDKNERVRSKSEILIANALTKAGVPYRYEYPLQLTSSVTIHPDFLCLNLRTRREFIWEHFGLMDNAEYAARTVNKIAAYQSNGYFPGKNLIITMENGTTPLNSKIISAAIRQYLQ